MKRKTILITVLLAVLAAALCLGGCGSMDPAVSQAVSALPFTVPPLFTYNGDATEQNGMLTFTSENGTTLIVSCTDSTEAFLEESRGEELTADSITASYQAAGLEVTVTGLDRQETEQALLYTYAVYYTNSNGTTITRKYIRITAAQVLDLSCGGNVANVDVIDMDYSAVLAAVQAGA